MDEFTLFKKLVEHKDLTLVLHSCFSLGEMSDNDRDNKKIVMNVVAAGGEPEIGSTMYLMSDRLRDDRDVMIAAVKLNGRMLHHASKRLRADRDVVLAALKNTAAAWDFALGNYKLCPWI